MVTTVIIPSTFQDTLLHHLPYADGKALDAADDLAALGLSSMGILQLLADLEREFSLELPDELLTEETFATVGSLWRTVAPLVGAEAAGDV
jgi:acyl carrier protein